MSPRPLLVSGVLIVAALTLFLLLARTFETQPVQELDQALADSMASPAWQALAHVSAIISALSSMPAIAGWVVLTATILMGRRAPRCCIAIVLVTPLLSVTTVGVAKAVVARDRPAVGEGFAFPSGHTTNVTTLLIVVLFLAVPIATAVGIWGRVGILVMLQIVVGSARVISGEHWPTDVIGGWLLGTILGPLLVLLGTATSRPPASAELN